MKLYIEQADNFYTFCIIQALLHLNIPHQVYMKNIPLFDFVTKENPDVLLLTDTPTNLRDVQFLKKEFPNLKIILLKIHYNHIQNSGNYFIIIDQQSLIRSCSFFYFNSEVKKQYKTNIIYINGNPHLEPYIINILNAIGYNTSLKIYGAKIPSPYYVGEPPIHEYKHILRSANGLLIYNNLEWTHNAVMNDCKPLQLDLQNPSSTIENMNVMVHTKNISKAISYEELMTEIIEEVNRA